MPRHPRRKPAEKEPLPEPPNTDEYRPFPTSVAVVYRGHGAAMARAVAPDPRGEWLASGADDGDLRLWEVETGRCVGVASFGAKCPIRAVAWSPTSARRLLAVAAGKKLFIIAPSFAGEAGDALTTNGREVLLSSSADANAEEAKDGAVDDGGKEEEEQPASDDGEEEVQDEEEEDEVKKQRKGKKKKKSHSGGTRWRPLNNKEHEQLERIIGGTEAPGIVIEHPRDIATLSWHRSGDYLMAVIQTDVSQPVRGTAALVHRLSECKSQRLHVTNKAGPVQTAAFHPSKPVIFIATQRWVRVYDVSRRGKRGGTLVKKLRPSARWVSSLAVHPSGEHVLIGSYDKRVCWFESDISSKPFKTLRHHKYAVRRVAFHGQLPLFASCSDDGRTQIFHATISSDWNTDPVLVPLRTLHGHTLIDGFGILDIAFHPTQPWIFTAGADGLIVLHVDKDLVTN
jgi:ribosome biogenesis protein ERB1